MLLSFEDTGVRVEFTDECLDDGTPDSTRMAGLLFAILGTPGTAKPKDVVVAELVIFMAADGMLSPRMEAWPGQTLAVVNLVQSAQNILNGWMLAESKRNVA